MADTLGDQVKKVIAAFLLASCSYAISQVSIGTGVVVGSGLSPSNPTFTGIMTGPQYINNGTCSGTVGTYCPPTGALLPANVIDARFISGVDCTGTTDSSAALNALTSTADTITSKTLSFRGCPQIRLDSQWLIHGQEFAEIDLGDNFNTSMAPANPSGTVIQGCNGAAGPVVIVDRSGYINFHGGSISAKKNTCTSSFTAALQFTNSGSGGYTSTAAYVHDIGLYYNPQGQSAANFIGFEIHGTPNQEEFHLDHVFINCVNGSNSIGFYNNDGNADSTLIENSASDNCMWSYRNDAGSVKLVHSESTGAQYSVFGAGASVLKGPFTVDGLICGDGAGTLLQPNAGVNGSASLKGVACAVNGSSAVDPNQYFIDPGNSQGNTLILLDGNYFVVEPGANPLNNTIIGVNGISGSLGPMGSFIQTSSVVTGPGGSPIPPTGYYLTNQIWSSASGRNTSTRFDANNYLQSAGTNANWSLFPTEQAVASNYPHRSAALGFIASLWNGSTNANDGYYFRNISTLNTKTTLAMSYSQPTGMTLTPSFAVQPAFSGISVTAADVASPDNLNTPSVRPQGTPGTTTYSYIYVGLAGCGNSGASVIQTTNTGNSTLSTTNYNGLGIAPTFGTWGFDIYRTVGGATQGKIGRLFVPTNTQPTAVELEFDDTGLVGDGTAPPIGNTSGCMQATSFDLLSGASWTSASGPPSGTCTNGSMYTNSAGTTSGNNNLYVCSQTAWLAVK